MLVQRATSNNFCAANNTTDRDADRNADRDS
jgi:hypothetical protein